MPLKRNGFQKECAYLFHVLFVRLNHLLDHLTADRTCLLGCEVTVVTVLKVNANLF